MCENSCENQYAENLRFMKSADAYKVSRTLLRSARLSLSPNTDRYDCFPGVNIRGGICYFLWSRDYNNKEQLTKVVTHEKENEYIVHRHLRYDNLDIFIRHGRALEILNKITNYSSFVPIMTIVSSRKPFGLSTDFTKTSEYKNNDKGMVEPLSCYGKGKQIGYVERNVVKTHSDWIDRWKVFVPRANNIGTELNDDNQNTFPCLLIWVTARLQSVKGWGMRVLR